MIADGKCQLIEANALQDREADVEDGVGCQAFRPCSHILSTFTLITTLGVRKVLPRDLTATETVYLGSSKTALPSCTKTAGKKSCKVSRGSCEGKGHREWNKKSQVGT